jgi:hypothetical protein
MLKKKSNIYLDLQYILNNIHTSNIFKGVSDENPFFSHKM